MHLCATALLFYHQLKLNIMKKLSILFLPIVVCVLITSTTSCVFIVKVAGIYRDPKPETPESIMDYCQKNNAYYDYLYMPKSDSVMIEISRRGYARLGRIEPFNNEQRAIYVNHPTKGVNGCPYTTASDYQLQDTAVVSLSENNAYFWDRLSLFQLVDKKEGLPNLEDNCLDYDFFLTLTWGKMMAKTTKSRFKEIHEASLIDSSKKVCVILLDFDARAGKDYFKAREKEKKQARKEAKKEAKQAKKQEK